MTDSRGLRRVRTAALLAWAFVSLFPLYWAAVTSLKGPLDITAGPVYLPFVDFTPTLEAWTYILFDSNDNPLLRAVNSLIVATTAKGLTVALGLCCAFTLTRIKAVFGFDNKFVTAAILAIRILPPVIVVLPVYLLAQWSHTLDTRFALIFVYTAANLPVAVWLLSPVLGPRSEVEEAAAIDGASPLRILVEIVTPAALPGIAAAGFILFLLSWNEYLFSVYLAPADAMTMPPFLAAQMSVREQQAGAEVEEWARLSAAICLMTIPLLFAAGASRRLLASVVSGR